MADWKMNGNGTAVPTFPLVGIPVPESQGGTGATTLAAALAPHLAGKVTAAGGDASATVVTPTGASTARTMADIAADADATLADVAARDGLTPETGKVMRWLADGSPENVSAVVDEAGKNIYDPAGAENGYYYNASNGVKTANAAYAESGLIPVAEGNRYTLSNKHRALANKFHFWGAGGAAQYLGGTTAGYPAGVNVVYRLTDSEVSFTVPVGSGIRYVGVTLINNVAHDVSEFDITRRAVMLEIADPATAFEAFNASGVKARLAAVEAAVTSLTADRFRVIKVGGQFFLRFAWDAVNDLCVRMDLASGSNGVSNWHATFLVPVGALDADVPAADAGEAILHANTDDATPIRANATTVGANHGHTQFVVITAAAHGKTDQDVGSYWSDGAAVKWTIIKVVDASTLWVLSDYTKVGDVYTFTLTETGNLTHVSGAVHTTTITPSARGTSQLYPAVKNLVATVKADGLTDITDASDGSWDCATLEFANSYEITDLASVLDFIKANPGVAPDFDAPAIETGAAMRVVYRFAPNASCAIFHTLRALKGLTIANCGFMQSGPLNQTAARKLLAYVPDVAVLSGWDMAGIEDITAGVDSLLYEAASWLDANKPPARMIQILKTVADAPVAGFQLAYSLLRGATVHATRKDAVTQAIDLRNTKKQYPVAIGASTTYAAGAFPAGTYIEVVEHRSYFNQADHPAATLATYVEEGPDAILYVDFHATVAFDAVPLPARFRGRTVTVIQKSASATIHSTVVGPEGVLLSASGGYGYAILKIS